MQTKWFDNLEKSGEKKDVRRPEADIHIKHVTRHWNKHFPLADLFVFIWLPFEVLTQLSLVLNLSTRNTAFKLFHHITGFISLSFIFLQSTKDCHLVHFSCESTLLSPVKKTILLRHFNSVANCLCYVGNISKRQNQGGNLNVSLGTVLQLMTESVTQKPEE